ncbi:MAG: hypothetical protein HZB38_04180 [Planctomycetes bacterium]|nr:hypothetical protein [Planctomycetota bacterium]
MSTPNAPKLTEILSVSWKRALLGAVLHCGFGAGLVLAQVSYSIDWQGPPIGFPSTVFGVPITEGDILTPPFFGPPAPGPLPPPSIAISGGFGPPAPGLMLPAHPAAIGHPPGVPGFVELDALSYGNDYAPRAPGFPFTEWYFSVDEFAIGLPGTPMPPAVWTEGAMGAAQASADVFMNTLIGGISPCAFPAATMGNTAVYDGDGLAPFGGPGVGLIEPNPPTPGIPVDPGSNLDALDVDTFVAPGIMIPVYFSLDAAFIDPLEGVPNSGSAATVGAFGGDVLLSPLPGAPPFVWIPSFMLGLDLMGTGTDDLDALAVWENGTGMYEPVAGLFSWTTGATDAVFFSVRRGSMLVLAGVPASRCGLPIEEGAILIPPVGPGLPPRIWIPAEALGLATVRSGSAMMGFGDDLDALDIVCNIPADLDNDRDVDLTDLTILLGSFGLGAGGDINGDGITDLTDLTLLLSQFGFVC